MVDLYINPLSVFHVYRRFQPLFLKQSRLQIFYLVGWNPGSL